MCEIIWQPFHQFAAGCQIQAPTSWTRKAGAMWVMIADVQIALGAGTLRWLFMGQAITGGWSKSAVEHDCICGINKNGPLWSCLFQMITVDDVWSESKCDVQAYKVIRPRLSRYMFISPNKATIQIMVQGVFPVTCCRCQALWVDVHRISWYKAHG